MNYLLLSALSLFVGILVGLTGIGGASLITPMLIIGFHVPAAIAISSDIVAATLMKLVGGYRHWQQQTLDWQIVRWLATGSVPGSWAGVAILHHLQGVESLNLDTLLLQGMGFAILGITSIALLQLLLLTFAPHLQLPRLPTLELDSLKGRVITVVIGFVLGSLVGLTSVSSGSLFALVMIACFRLEPQKLVGTDLTQGAILLLFTSLGHLSLGTVDWRIVAAISTGAIPGVILGAKLCQFAPQRLLKFGLYLILVLVSWRLAHTGL
jgi:uncharacterized membrane protein YfcA